LQKNDRYAYRSVQNRDDLMKLHILCDLHIEFGDFEVPDVGAEVVILAGDIHVKKRGLQWIFDQKFGIPVLYVLGNHEFYGEKFPGLINRLKRDSEGTNVRILENDSVNIGGYRFFGCTLWSDMALLGDPLIASVFAARGMNDYRLTRHSKTFRRLLPSDTVSWHSGSVKKLREFFEAGDPDRSVVVTHHAPSIQSIADKFRRDPLSAAFTSNMDDFILEHQPRLWIHGHTHKSFAYRIGKTRVICNPKGYASIEENKGFKPDYTVEL
jgi:Icc-related predicted phosphoesterase